MNLSTKQDIETGVLIALALLLLGWFQQTWAFVFISGGVLGTTLVLPIIFRPTAYLWFGLARILGYIMSHVLLTVVFFLLIVPVGLIRKWMGKDSLQLNSFQESSGSVLKNRGHVYQPEDLTNPF